LFLLRRCNHSQLEAVAKTKGPALSYQAYIPNSDNDYGA
jgi:hypothetical protein